jgi:hypothetical protein
MEKEKTNTLEEKAAEECINFGRGVVAEIMKYQEKRDIDSALLKYDMMDNQIYSSAAKLLNKDMTKEEQENLKERLSVMIGIDYATKAALKEIDRQVLGSARKEEDDHLILAKNVVGDYIPIRDNMMAYLKSLEGEK